MARGRARIASTSWLWPAGLALQLFAAPGFAQQTADASISADWRCELCTSATGWQLDLEAGPAYVFDDAFRFGDYTGLGEQGAYLPGDLLTRYRNGRAYALIEGYSMGRDAYGLFARGGRQSAYEVRVALQSIPRRLFDATRTPFSDAGAGNLTLPSSWVRAPTTGGMTALSSTAAPFELGYERRRFGLGFDYELHRDFELSVDFSRQERKGTTRSSAAMLFSALEFASPIDYATDDVEIGLSYAQDRWQASASYFVSSFSNDVPGIRWDNPYTAISGATTGQLAPAPDNDAQRITLAASALLPARTTVNGMLSIGRLSQDMRLLPFTTNPTLPVTSLPTANADARVDTLTMNLRAVSSPWSRLTLQGELRLHDFDNKTPIEVYDYVITDILPAESAARSTAYDYERRQLKLRGEYRLASAMRLAFGTDFERFERSAQDRKRTDTGRLWASVDSRLAGVAELHLEAFIEDRDGSSYETVLDPTAPENPLMRKYNLANREREGIELRAAYFGFDRADLGFEVEFSEDDYDEGLLGLTSADYLRAGFDFSYLVGAAGSVYANLYNERIESSQANSQSFSLPDWAATTNDEFTSATVGAVYPELFGRFDAEFELGYSRGTGEIRSDTSGLVTRFPDLESRRRTARIGLSYPFSQNLRLSLDYVIEKLDSDDWALDGVDLATAPSLLSLGASAWNYDTSILYLSAHYRVAPTRQR